MRGGGSCAAAESEGGLVYAEGGLVCLRRGHRGDTEGGPRLIRDRSQIGPRLSEIGQMALARIIFSREKSFDLARIVSPPPIR